MDQGLNKVEHEMKFGRFLIGTFLYGLLGYFIGILIDLLFRNLRKDPNSRLKCATILCAWLLFVCFLAYISLKFPSPIRNILLDDWAMSTWEGYVFVLVFISAQGSLSDTMQCALRGNVSVS